MSLEFPGLSLFMSSFQSGTLLLTMFALLMYSTVKV